MAKIDSLFKLMKQQGASDLHISAGAPPLFRLHGEMEKLNYPPLSDQQARGLLFEILTREQRALFDETLDLDFAYSLEGVARFRGNLLETYRGIAGVFRIVPTKILTADQLGLPEGIRKLTKLKKGLVLVTGPTGSGKSTTLAAMIDLINKTRREHILTLEDPLEFIHENQLSLMNQRQIGQHSHSFANALRAALREDPDVILVGEMRDPETIDIALKAAETGHMVFSTVHTTDAAKTVGRLVGVFPAEEQQQVRLRLADNLKGVISQRLLPHADRKGRVLAAEVMVATKTVQEYIKDAERASQLKDVIEKGRDQYGMQSFDQHLTQLYQKGQISLDVAKSAASNPSDFERALNFAEESPDAPAEKPEEESILELMD